MAEDKKARAAPVKKADPEQDEELAPVKNPEKEPGEADEVGSGEAPRD